MKQSGMTRCDDGTWHWFFGNEGVWDDETVCGKQGLKHTSDGPETIEGNQCALCNETMFMYLGASLEKTN